jgi:hypothetical protein
MYELATLAPFGKLLIMKSLQLLRLLDGRFEYANQPLLY